MIKLKVIKFDLAPTLKHRCFDYPHLTDEQKRYKVIHKKHCFMTT